MLDRSTGSAACCRREPTDFQCPCRKPERSPAASQGCPPDERARSGPRGANSAPSQRPLADTRAPAEGDGVATSPVVGDRIAKTTCYMCACRCGIDVHICDGKVRYIAGNKDHPVNRGVLCGKGAAGIMQHYSPARLSKPLLRTGPRGVGRIPRDRMGGGAGDRHRAPGPHPRHRPQAARLLHRPRPVAVAHRLVGEPLRHPQLCGPRRLLLGQHGGGRPLHHRRLVLGVRPARLGIHQVFHALRRGRGPRFQPHQDRPGPAQGARRAHRLRQPVPHRLQRHRRRLDRHPPRHRRPARAGHRARAAEGRPGRSRLPDPLHQRALPGRHGARRPGRRPPPAQRAGAAARLGPAHRVGGRCLGGGHLPRTHRPL